jgi:hypothetical protein
MKALLTQSASRSSRSQAAISTASAADSDIGRQQYSLRRGVAASLQGKLKGDDTVDYVVRAAAGQTLSVTLKKTNPQNYFNVLPPGSNDVAMYVGQTGDDFKGVLPTDGDYTVRVYLMRAAARRNEASDYTLTVGVTGKALAALPASQDAILPGTPFHASAPISCVPFLETNPAVRGLRHPPWRRRNSHGRDCPAELRQAPHPVRAGQARSPRIQDALSFSLPGDVTVVKLGAEERYDVPMRSYREATRNASVCCFPRLRFRPRRPSSRPRCGG